MMISKCEDSNKLMQLVTLFEENEKELTDVPKEMIEKYGFSCLANSLMFKKPKIPKHDKDTISEYMKTHTFLTIDSLCNYIISIKNDIDKLFAIFAWAALNIQYDVEAYLSDNIKSTTLEEVFETKRAVCSGYALFFNEMVKRTKINTDKIIVKEYSNYAKGYSYNCLSPPKNVNSNHASVYIEIDGNKFICEPTWGSGYLDENKQRHQRFNPNYFLIPLYDTLNDHYPCNESKQLLPFNFHYQDYLNSCKLCDLNRQIKTESNPFCKILCKNGYLEQTYSCIAPINKISAKIFIKKNDCFYRITEQEIFSYDIIQKKLPKHPERCRFRTSISFPQKGFYRVEMFIDTHMTLCFYVDNLMKCTESVPVGCDPWNKFIPITPTNICSHIKTNYALIRFTISSKKSNILWEMNKINKKDDIEEINELLSSSDSFITLTLPFDEERYEDLLLVNFPSSGKYEIKIYLANDYSNNYDYFISYYFDVDIISNTEKKSIFDFLLNDRSFNKKTFYYKDHKELIVRPSFQWNIINECEQIIEIKTESIDEHIHLEIRKDKKTIMWPECIKQTDDQFRCFKLIFPNEEGEYELLGWFNNNQKNSLQVHYFYVKNSSLKNPTKDERKINDYLMKKIEQENKEDSYKEIKHKNIEPKSFNYNNEKDNKVKNETSNSIDKAKNTQLKNNVTKKIDSITEPNENDENKKSKKSKEIDVKSSKSEENNDAEINKPKENDDNKKSHKPKEKNNKTKLNKSKDDDAKSRKSEECNDDTKINESKENDDNKKPFKPNENSNRTVCNKINENQKSKNKIGISRNINNIQQFENEINNESQSINKFSKNKRKERNESVSTKKEFRKPLYNHFNKRLKVSNYEQYDFKNNDDNNNCAGTNKKKQNMQIQKIPDVNNINQSIDDKQIIEIEKNAIDINIISIDNYDPNHPLPINDPLTIKAINTLGIKMNDIVYPDDITIQCYSFDPNDQTKIRKKLQKCVNILIHCIKKERMKIIKEIDINDTEKESNDIDIYKQKVDEIKDYLIRIKKHYSDKREANQNDDIKKNEAKQIDNDEKSNLETIQTPEKQINQLQSNQNILKQIKKYNEMILGKQYYINNVLMKNVYKANLQIIESKTKNNENHTKEMNREKVHHFKYVFNHPILNQKESTKIKTPRRSISVISTKKLPKYDF